LKSAGSEQINRFTPTPIDPLFVRDQLNNAIVVRKFTQFLKEQNSLPRDLASFEEFVQISALGSANEAPSDERKNGASR